ncbi:MAG TPA: HD domain-containing phosphohydrolase [Solirubrobacteraceae bacterium]
MRLARKHPVLSAAVAALAAGVAFESSQSVIGFGGQALNGFADDWIYTAVEVLAVAVCLARVLRRRDDRAAWALMTFGLVMWTAGDLTWTLWLDNVANPPYPSIADALYLAMYPAIYASLMLLIRSRQGDTGAAQWLDGGVVGLTVAAIAAALTFPAVAGGGGRFIAVVVNVAYPVGDFVLLIFVAVAYSLAGWRPGRAWLLVGLGVTVSAVADIVFVYQAAKGTYAAGTLLDAMWPAAMALLAVAAWMPMQGLRRGTVDAPHTIVLTLLAATSALALLVTAAFRTVTPLAVGLAAGSLVLASVRAALTYLENVRILRRNARNALTDPLSGLPNRRALMEDLERAFAAAKEGPAATLAFFDLNGFKRYNDTFGHAAGDALLARIGFALRRSIGDSGRAYRLGGDEFCVLLDGRFARHDPVIGAAAAALVERGSAFTVSASVGLAIVPDDAPSAGGALQLADERMYAEKASSSASRAQARDVLMQLLSERTPGLHQHVTSVGTLANAIGIGMQLEPEDLDVLLRAAELHDVGKLAIPDQILEKAGTLTSSEWDFMRQHPVIGERILNAAPALRPVARLVRSSHERWDGAGYPDGLAGDQIPLGARIVSVCDAFEAITSDRVYQPARSRAVAIAELRRGAGTQFDPVVVDAVCHHLQATEKVVATGAGPPPTTGSGQASVGALG